jgi:hypothetical protein
VNSTGEVDTLRIAEASARVEESVRVEELSSESELGLALIVWRKQEGLRWRGIR